MPDRQLPDRRSIRLPQWDYATTGAYFVTVVTHDRVCLFDDAVLRRTAESIWQSIPAHFPGARLDLWVLMPNHMHGIIILSYEPEPGKPAQTADRQGPSAAEVSVLAAQAPQALPQDPKPLHAPLRLQPGSLGAIIGNYKSITARRINSLRRTPGEPVWQRNYYERIVRNERELAAIRQYIQDNPAHWAEDNKNPENHLPATQPHP